MKIIQAKEKDLEGLIDIYKAVFKKHNVFEKSREEVLEYLKKTQERDSKDGGGYIVAVEDKTVVAGLLLSKTDSCADKHSVWKYRHIGVMPNYAGKGIGSSLLKEAEKILSTLIKKGTIKTAKVEITVSENEKDALKFYEKNGFKKEGSLSNHYRWNETTYILGKSLGGK